MNTPSYTRSSWVDLLLPLFVGGCCLGLWWWEWHSRWQHPGANWLREAWWSVYATTGLTVAVFLAPLRRAWTIPWRWMALYAVVLYAASWGSYSVARSIFYTLYTEGLLGRQPSVSTASIWKLFALVLALSAVYFVPLWQFHHSTDRLHILTLVEVFVAVVPSSLITLAWFPSESGSQSFLQAVYLGYPFFWVPVLLGWMATATAREWI